MCEERNLPIEYSIEKVEEEWLGKAKGSFQIIYERRWIYPDNL